MKIRRSVATVGAQINLEISLTDEELEQAYREQQFKYDQDDIVECLNDNEEELTEEFGESVMDMCDDRLTRAMAINLRGKRDSGRADKLGDFPMEAIQEELSLAIKARESAKWYEDSPVK